MSELRTNERHCEGCGISLQGDSIVRADQHLYGATHFSREIAIYSQGLDRTVAFQCPDCGHQRARA